MGVFAIVTFLSILVILTVSFILVESHNKTHHRKIVKDPHKDIADHNF
jgi:hypothetical protein